MSLRQQRVRPPPSRGSQRERLSDSSHRYLISSHSLDLRTIRQPAQPASRSFESVDCPISHAHDRDHTGPQDAPPFPRGRLERGGNRSRAPRGRSFDGARELDGVFARQFGPALPECLEGVGAEGTTQAVDGPFDVAWVPLSKSSLPTEGV
jgi:hypothetical protein